MVGVLVVGNVVKGVVGVVVVLAVLDHRIVLASDVFLLFLLVLLFLLFFLQITMLLRLF